MRAEVQYSKELKTFKVKDLEPGQAGIHEDLIFIRVPALLGHKDAYLYVYGSGEVMFANKETADMCKHTITPFSGIITLTLGE